LASNG